MMKIVILIRPYFSTIYSLILILFHLSNTSDNIKQKCIVKSLFLGVLCANFGRFLSRHLTL